MVLGSQSSQVFINGGDVALRDIVSGHGGIGWGLDLVTLEVISNLNSSRILCNIGGQSPERRDSPISVTKLRVRGTETGRGQRSAALSTGSGVPGLGRWGPLSPQHCERAPRDTGKGCSNRIDSTN